MYNGMHNGTYSDDLAAKITTEDALALMLPDLSWEYYTNSKKFFLKIPLALELFTSLMYDI